MSNHTEDIYSLSNAPVLLDEKKSTTVQIVKSTFPCLTVSEYETHALFRIRGDTVRGPKIKYDETSHRYCIRFPRIDRPFPNKDEEKDFSKVHEYELKLSDKEEERSNITIDKQTVLYRSFKLKKSPHEIIHSMYPKRKWPPRFAAKAWRRLHTIVSAAKREDEQSEKYINSEQSIPCKIYTHGNIILNIKMRNDFIIRTHTLRRWFEPCMMIPSITKKIGNMKFYIFGKKSEIRGLIWTEILFRSGLIQKPPFESKKVFDILNHPENGNITINVESKEHEGMPMLVKVENKTFNVISTKAFIQNHWTSNNNIEKIKYDNSNDYKYSKSDNVGLDTQWKTISYYVNHVDFSTGNETILELKENSKKKSKKAITIIKHNKENKHTETKETEETKKNVKENQVQAAVYIRNIEKEIFKRLRIHLEPYNPGGENKDSPNDSKDPNNDIRVAKLTTEALGDLKKIKNRYKTFPNFELDIVIHIRRLENRNDVVIVHKISDRFQENLREKHTITNFDDFLKYFFSKNTVGVYCYHGTKENLLNFLIPAEFKSGTFSPYMKVLDTTYKNTECTLWYNDGELPFFISNGPTNCGNEKSFHLIHDEYKKEHIKKIIQLYRKGGILPKYISIKTIIKKVAELSDSHLTKFEKLWTRVHNNPEFKETIKNIPEKSKRVFCLNTLRLKLHQDVATFYKLFNDLNGIVKTFKLIPEAILGNIEPFSYYLSEDVSYAYLTYDKKWGSYEDVKKANDEIATLTDTVEKARLFNTLMTEVKDQGYQDPFENYVPEIPKFETDIANFESQESEFLNDNDWESEEFESLKKLQKCLESYTSKRAELLETYKEKMKEFNNIRKHLFENISGTIVRMFPKAQFGNIDMDTFKPFFNTLRDIQNGDDYKFLKSNYFTADQINGVHVRITEWNKKVKIIKDEIKRFEEGFEYDVSTDDNKESNTGFHELGSVLVRTEFKTVVEKASEIRKIHKVAVPLQFKDRKMQYNFRKGAESSLNITFMMSAHYFHNRDEGKKRDKAIKEILNRKRGQLIWWSDPPVIQSNVKNVIVCASTHDTDGKPMKDVIIFSVVPYEKYDS
jgi:hypothetical protein